VLNREFTRELDPSEIYYELIDHAWPMNALCVAEFDEAFSADQVEHAWNRLAEQVPIIGARVERTSGREAHMVFGTPRGTLSIARHDDVPSAWAHESRMPFDVAAGPMVRCALVEQDSGASVVFVSHHSALDGRSIVELAMLFAGVMIDQADVTDHPLAEPTLALHLADTGRSAGEHRLSDSVATARQMRDEDGFVGAAGTVAWHHVQLDSPRDVGFSLFDLTEDETSGLISWARSQQATVHGALSAAVLRAAVTVTPGLNRVGLSASVDLRSRFDAPKRGSIGQAAGVIAASYEATGASGAMARLVSSDIRRRFDRGEGELLYALSGAGRFPVDHTADRVIKRWTGQATPTFFLGNVGVVTGPAPRALQRITPGLAPIPNQVAYVAASTFRNRLGLSVGYDRNRLTIDPDGFAAAVHSQVLELARTGARSAALR
jgi:hypothetical protein